MHRSFKLDNLDCADCAAKMERGISKLDGVDSVTVAFMTSRLTIDADDARFDSIMQQAQDVISRIEPDCAIVRR